MTTFVVDDKVCRVEFRLLRDGRMETKINNGEWGLHAPSEYQMSGGESETVRLALEHIAPLFQERRPLPSMVKEEKKDNILEPV